MAWLCETFQTDLTLVEGKSGEFRVKGLFGICGVPTSNGRIYERKLIEREIGRLRDRIEGRQVMMQLDHPSDGRPSLERVAGLITNLRLEGDNVIGEARIVGTPMGEIIKQLVKAGVRIGVSSRGFGSTQTTEAGDVVGEDFALQTYDFVAQPSVESALPKFYTESKEQVAQETPLELFQREFPEAYGQLTEAAARDAVARAQEQTARAIEQAVAAERERALGEQREAFERELRDAVVGLREDLTRELREQYEADPAVAGARGALAAIAEMVGAYRQQPDEAALRDALKARELEVAAAVGATEQAEARACQAERLLKLERKLAGNPLAEALRKVVAPAALRGADATLDADLDALIEEATGLVPATLVEERAAERIAAEKDREVRSQLEQQVEQLKGRLQEAVQIGQELDAQVQEAEGRATDAESKAQALEEAVGGLKLEVYKRTRVQGLANGAQVLRLLEGAGDRAAVDEVVAASGAKAMADGDLERARQAVRGMAPGATSFVLEEDAPVRGHGATDDVLAGKASASELAILAGVD